METSAWESISEDTQLKLEYTPHTFVLCAADTSGKGGVRKISHKISQIFLMCTNYLFFQQCLNDTLDESFVFSKSTDEFYNYRVSGFIIDPYQGEPFG